MENSKYQCSSLLLIFWIQDSLMGFNCSIEAVVSHVIFEVWNTLNLADFSSGDLPHSLLISYSCHFSKCWAPSYIGPHARIRVALNCWNDYFYLLYKLMKISWFIPQIDLYTKMKFQISDYFNETVIFGDL